MKIKILIATHKEAIFPKNEIFMPIQVEKALSNKDLGIQGDNTGENISKKGPCYSELTALFWAWKNLNDLDYIGFCQYRRYFDIDSSPNISKFKIKLVLKNYLLQFMGRLIVVFYPYKNLSIKWIKYISKNELDAYSNQFQSKLLEQIKKHDYDIFYVKPFFSFNRTVQESFFIGGYYYFQQLEKIILEKFTEYKPMYDKVMKGHIISTSNLHLMKKEIFDEYCSFVFGVLERHLELNKKEGISYFRILGYMAEILATVFIFKKKQDSAIRTKTMNHLYVREYFIGRTSPLQ